MEPAKLQFSPHEMKLVGNADWILTKNEILGKIGRLLGRLNVMQKEIVNRLPQSLPEEILATTAKISRGENYKGLPYLVLDYPRLFTKNNIFAIRSMFWWGRTMSTTLHLSGRWQKHFAATILAHHEVLAEDNSVIATGENEWEHDVTGDGYAPVNSFTKKYFEELISRRPFLKISLFADVNELANGPEVWESQFNKIIKLL